MGAIDGGSLSGVEVDKMSGRRRQHSVRTIASVTKVDVAADANAQCRDELMGSRTGIVGVARTSTGAGTESAASQDSLSISGRLAGI